LEEGKLTPATIVDNIIPHKETTSCSGTRRIGSLSAIVTTAERQPKRMEDSGI
jgi:hypothetical protein